MFEHKESNTGTASYFENFLHVIHGISAEMQRKLMSDKYFAALENYFLKKKKKKWISGFELAVCNSQFAKLLGSLQMSFCEL